MTKNPGVSLGRGVLDKRTDPRLGKRVIGKLAADLREAFPEMKGFSRRNPWYMRSSAAAWPEREIVQEAVAQLSWRQNIALLEKVGGPGERLWCAGKTLEQGWSSNILVLQIKAQAQVDRLLSHPDENPTLGLLLVRERNRVLVEHALDGNTKPISVAEWDTRLTHALPEDLQASLPTVEQIEAALDGLDEQ